MTAARDGAHFCSEFPAICTLLLNVSPLLQGGPSWPELSGIGPSVQPPSPAHLMLGLVVMQGTEWCRIRSGEFKFKSLQKQSHLSPKFLPQSEKVGEMWESHVSLPQLFTVATAFSSFSRGLQLQQYLPKPGFKLQQPQADPKGTCPVTNIAQLNHWHLGLGKPLTKT